MTVNCPKCKKKFEIGVATTWPGIIEPGSIIVCSTCEGVSIILEDLSIRSVIPDIDLSEEKITEIIEVNKMHLRSERAVWN